MKVEKTENGNIGIKMYDYPCTEFDAYLLVLSPQAAQEAALRMLALAGFMGKLATADENSIIEGSKVYKAVESGIGCCGCAFNHMRRDCDFSVASCESLYRKDERDIIWEEVAE